MLKESDAFSDHEVSVCLEMVDETLEEPSKKEYFFECAIDEKEDVTGFVSFGEAALAENVWELYWIAVDGSAKGKGVGRRLMDHAESAMRTAGGRMCVIETSGRPQYSGTNEFYKKCGYREAARIQDFYREGDDLVIYRKDLGV